jgi:hypothetical protein
MMEEDTWKRDTLKRGAVHHWQTILHPIQTSKNLRKIHSFKMEIEKYLKWKSSRVLIPQQHAAARSSTEQEGRQQECQEQGEQQECREAENPIPTIAGQNTNTIVGGREQYKEYKVKEMLELEIRDLRHLVELEERNKKENERSHQFMNTVTCLEGMVEMLKQDIPLKQY